MIRDLLPYESQSSFSLLPNDLTGWNGDHWLIKNLVQNLKPRLVIEVGSWKGLSAISMHNALKEVGVEHEIVCVDTWLGSVEHMLRHHEDLRYENGRPDLYLQFMSNVIHAGAWGSITPIVQHSLTAAKWFAHMGIQADAIYIDASHEQGDVIRDLEAYWPLVRKGGWMFGDDYAADWSGVIHDVNEFFAKHVSEIDEFNVRERFWFARKR